MIQSIMNHEGEKNEKKEYACLNDGTILTLHPTTGWM